MTIALKHPFTSAKADGGDATLVRPSNWNAAHNPFLAKTNRSGATVAQYAWVVSDTANDDSFTTTTVASSPRPGFVVQDAAGIANNVSGNVLPAGWDSTVLVQGNVTRGNWLITSTTAGRLADSGTACTSAPPLGAVGVATSSYGGGGAGSVTAYFGLTAPSITVTAPFATQTVVTGSRALNTTYQNTSGRTRMVTVTVASTGAHGNNVYNATALTDSATPPVTTVAGPILPADETTVTAAGTLSFMVLANNYYRITAGGNTSLVCWTEWD